MGEDFVRYSGKWLVDEPKDTMLLVPNGYLMHHFGRYVGYANELLRRKMQTVGDKCTKGRTINIKVE